MLYWDHVYGSGNKGGICVITFIILTIFILLLATFIDEFILRRKLHIKEIRLHIFSKNRNKLLLKIEIILKTYRSYANNKISKKKKIAN